MHFAYSSPKATRQTSQLIHSSSIRIWTRSFVVCMWVPLVACHSKLWNGGRREGIALLGSNLAPLPQAAHWVCLAISTSKSIMLDHWLFSFALKFLLFTSLLPSFCSRGQNDLTPDLDPGSLLLVHLFGWLFLAFVLVLVPTCCPELTVLPVPDPGLQLTPPLPWLSCGTLMPTFHVFVFQLACTHLPKA